MSGLAEATAHFAVIVAAVALTACSAPVGAQTSNASAPRVLDDFSDVAAWEAGASDGVRATVQPAAGPQGAALRLDFDLAGTAGYAIARRALPIDFPANYELSFYVRADALVNDFQFKLIDASGDNVWWVNRRNFDFPRDWQRIRIKKRQIEFAWGPGKDRALNRTAALEFVVAAGRGGGKGSILVSRFELWPLPPETAEWPTPVVRASSALAGADPMLALDGDPATAWTSDPAAGLEQALTLDFGRPREFGGLVLRWNDRAFASRYDVQFSDDGARWRTVRSVGGGNGGPDALALPESETRFLRLALHDGPARRYGLSELEIKDLAFGASPNAFFQALARDSPRGFYPRGFSGEQSCWTIVGIDGGSETGLLSEDGALEVARGGFSIEPFVVTDSQVTTWANVETRASLVDRYLPIPGVTWRRPEWELQVVAFAKGSRAASQLVARYDVRNLTDRPQTLTLALAVRPFQVNPPAQFLNAPGGVSPIHDIEWDGTALAVNGARRVFPLSSPDHVGAFTVDAGPVPRLLAARAWPEAHAIHDPAAFASAVLTYRIALAPRATRTVGLTVPLTGAAPTRKLGGASVPGWLAREQKKTAAAWRAKLDRVAIRIPAAGQPLVDTLRTSLAHVLITRDGPVLRPGTRSYARSWIRDGAMMAESLLRVGHPGVAVDYLRWYAPYQFENGKVPCCVDERGADPVPENDSAGELIFLAMMIYRHTGDHALLASTWPHLDAAARYVERQRQSERTEANQAQDRQAFFGLLPASISHEGYSERPMHSYWDDFWALKGYEAIVEAATILGHDDEARRLARARDEFRHDLAASLRETMAAHRIAYIPGSAELGDFDPTSTAIAFAPGGDVRDLPATAVAATYERYWHEFVDRRDGRKAWTDYTPYELRNVGTFVRLGWRERAHELLAFFFGGRCPQRWNQWAEVVGRDMKEVRFVGDMPHGWVASDFIRSALDLFAYERTGDEAVVLGAGIPAAWLQGPGIAVRGLRTRYGVLNYSAKMRGVRVQVRIARGSTPPPGGFVLAFPGQEAPTVARVNGRIVNATELRVRNIPAEIVLEAR